MTNSKEFVEKHLDTLLKNIRTGTLLGKDFNFLMKLQKERESVLEFMNNPDNSWVFNEIEEEV
jgi:hypothetical protein